MHGRDAPLGRLWVAETAPKKLLGLPINACTCVCTLVYSTHLNLPINLITVFVCELIRPHQGAVNASQHSWALEPVHGFFMRLLLES
jgi:hypothetical protein